MRKLLLATALMLHAIPAWAAEYTIMEVSDANGGMHFEPDKITIKPGDTVTFENAQDEMHNVMFVSQPKQVDEMIMSPMHTKKGEKFSYTFTVPGTYQFHCHPHEEMGMKGTLIVGAASMAGETKMMDHHKLAKKLEGGEPAAGAKPSAGNAAATGKVISVDADKHTIKIKHDPIKSLGWPTMIMLFTADSDVDLSGYKEGDDVSFTLKPVGKDDYTVSNIKKN